MAPLAVSVAVHLALVALLLSISDYGVARATARAPVRITYFEQPLHVPSGPPLNLALPEVDVDPSALPGRPMTAPLPSDVGVGRPGSDGGVPSGSADAGAGEGGSTAQSAPPTPAPAAAATPQPALEEQPPGDKPPRAPVTVVAPAVEAPLPREAAAPAATPRRPAEPTPVPRATPRPPPPQPPEAVASISGARPGEIVDLGPGMPSPVITKRVVPKYPPMARSQRVRGIVQVEVVIDSRGVVTDARVVASPSPLLNKEALDAARALRFKPYEVDGQVVSVRTRVPFRFDFN